MEKYDKSKQISLLLQNPAKMHNAYQYLYVYKNTDHADHLFMFDI